jgi:hypothetical protein
MDDNFPKNTKPGNREPKIFYMPHAQVRDIYIIFLREGTQMLLLGLSQPLKIQLT